jgi:hypothetical protein
MWSDEVDVFSIKSWNSAFASLNSWRAERKPAKTGLAPFILAAGLAVAATHGLASDRNLATTATHMHGPPIPSPNVSRVIDVPMVLASGQDQVEPVFLEEPEEGAFRPAALNAELKKLQRMQRSLIDLVSINSKTVRVARLIAHQIPTPITPSIGFDESGNVFLHFKDERVDAYLTIEQRALHLFCKVVGARNIYIDDEPFIGKRLPKKIRDKFSEIFVA